MGGKHGLLGSELGAFSSFDFGLGFGVSVAGFVGHFGDDGAVIIKHEFIISLFFRFGNVGGAAVVGEDDLVFFSFMVVERDVEFVGESVDDRAAYAEAGERARAGHESDFF